MNSFAMFGRQRQRVAESERVRFEKSSLPGPPFRLVGHKDHGGSLASQNVRKSHVVRKDTGTCIDHEKTSIGRGNRALGQTPHAPLQAFVVCFFQSGRVHDRTMHSRKSSFTLPHVPRHPRLVVDERETFAHESIEQRRLAHVGTSDNG